MRLVIGSRKSDLARLQSYAVANAIKNKYPHVQVDFEFKVSLGDQNQHDPLWKMPQKGVFTEDFIQDLENEKVDMVVHSWKDLPTDPRATTEIVATLARADARDLLLFKKSSLERKDKKLHFFSSSPRRAYNIAPFLKNALPFATTEIRFENVRGNIQTRVRKYLEADAIDGLIVAKAAIDRLLSQTADEFTETKKILRDALKLSEFMVLPLSENPSAAAQGALAIEIKKGRTDIHQLLNAINEPQVFAAVEKERRILKSYGGGCHQKIGVSVLPRAFGEVTFLRGLTDQGEILDRFECKSPQTEMIPAPQSRNACWPMTEQPRLFEREAIEASIPLADGYYVAKLEAWPKGLVPPVGSLVWTAGVKTWQKLASLGIWVHGTSDSLGEGEPMHLEAIAPEALSWIKFTHLQAPEDQGHKMVATYQVLPRPELLSEWQGKTHFYWTSGVLFAWALEQMPELQKAFHFCGPGNTLRRLSKELGHPPAGVYLSLQSWQTAMYKRVNP